MKTITKKTNILGEFFRGTFWMLFWALMPLWLWGLGFMFFWLISFPFDLLSTIQSFSYAGVKNDMELLKGWQAVKLLAMLAGSSKITLWITDPQMAIDILVDYIISIWRLGHDAVMMIYARIFDILDIFLDAWGFHPTYFSSRVYSDPWFWNPARRSLSYIHDPEKHFFPHEWLAKFVQAFWIQIEETFGPVEPDWQANWIFPLELPPPGGFQLPPWPRGDLKKIAYEFFKTHCDVVIADPDKYKDCSIFELRRDVPPEDWYMFWNYFYLKYVEKLYPKLKVGDFDLMREVMSKESYKNAYRRWYFFVFEYRQALGEGGRPMMRFPRASEIEAWYLSCGALEAYYREWYFFNFLYAPCRYMTTTFPMTADWTRGVETTWDRLNFLMWYYFNSPEVRLNEYLAMGVEFAEEDGFIPLEKLIELIRVNPRKLLAWEAWIRTQKYWELRLFEKHYLTDVDNLATALKRFTPPPPPPYIPPRTEYASGKIDLADWLQWNATLITPWTTEPEDLYSWKFEPPTFENDLDIFEIVNIGGTRIPKEPVISHGRLTRRIYDFFVNEWTGYRRQPQIEMRIHDIFYTHSDAFTKFVDEHFKQHKGILIDLKYYKKYKPTGLRLILSLKPEDQYFFWNRYYMIYVDNRLQGFEWKMLTAAFWDLRLLHISEYPFTINYFNAWYFINIVDSSQYLKPGERIRLWSEIVSKFEFEYFWLHFLRWEFFNFRWPLFHDTLGKTYEDYPLSLKDIRNMKSPDDELVFLAWYYFNFILPVGFESQTLFSPTTIFQTMSNEDYLCFCRFVERLVFTNYYDFGRYEAYEDLLAGDGVNWFVQWDSEVHQDHHPQALINEILLASHKRIVTGGGDLGEADVALRLTGPIRLDYYEWLQEYQDYAAVHGTLRSAPPESFSAVKDFRLKPYSTIPWGTPERAHPWFEGLFTGSKNIGNLVMSPRVHPYHTYQPDAPNYVKKLPKFGVDPKMMFSRKKYFDWTPTYTPRTQKPLASGLCAVI